MMARLALSSSVLCGVGLTLAYTVLISGADALTKAVAQGFAAPQMFAVSGLLVAAFALLAGRGAPRTVTHLPTPRAMAFRSGLTVIAALCFFGAFARLPFAQVFLFIALMPLIAAVLSGPVLGEPVRGAAWGAMGLGVLGVICLFPTGAIDPSFGHLLATLAVLSGTGSMLASRWMGRQNVPALSQVFYPNLALAVSMSVALPWVWRTMNAESFAMICLYAGALFLARWAIVAALSRIPATTAMPLLNLQFVWMVLIGYAAFGEMPQPLAYVGAGIVIAAGCWLVAIEAGWRAPSDRKAGAAATA